MACQTTVWSQYPVHVFTSEAFSHAINHAHYGQKTDIGNTRPLIEFANSVDRIRRKWLLRTQVFKEPHRPAITRRLFSTCRGHPRGSSAWRSVVEHH